MLSLLLRDGNFRRDAVDCLLIIVERKGAKDDRIPLLRLFDYVDLLVAAGFCSVRYVGVSLQFILLETNLVFI
jgi:hypothetical protein